MVFFFVNGDRSVVGGFVGFVVSLSVVVELKAIFVDFVDNVMEGLFNIMASHCTGFNVSESIVVSKGLCLYMIHLSLVIHITLVAHQHHHNVLTSPTADLFHPLVQVVKTILIGQVKYNNSPHSPSVVSTSDCPVLLLSCCVPYLCLHHKVFHLQYLCCKLYSYRRFRFNIKFIFCKTRY